MAMKIKNNCLKIFFSFMSPKEEKMHFFPWPPFTYSFFFFISPWPTQKCQVEVCEGSVRRGLGEVSFWYLPLGNAAHCLLQEQLLKVLATGQKAADCKNKPYPPTIHKREEMKALCFSYKPELSSVRRVEQAVLKITVFSFMSASWKLPPWLILLPLPRGSLEKSGCSQSRLWQSII